MEIRTMEVQQLNERKSQIVEELEQPNADLDALEKEVRAINEELEQRKAVALQKEEIRNAVAQGQGEVITQIEEKKEERTMERNSMEYRNLWLRNLQGNLNIEERDAFAQATTHAVPTIVADKMFAKLKKTAPMLDEITLMQVAGNLTFTAQNSRANAGTHVENAEISLASDSTIAVELGAKEIVKIVGISKSAAKMSVDAFEEWLVDYLAEDVARQIDNYVINDSTHGLSVKATAIEDGIDATYAGICQAIAALPAGYDANAKVLINKKTLYTKVAGITSQVGLPVFVPDTREGFQGRLMGYPVVLDDYVADNVMYIGDLKHIVGNLSEGIDVEMDSSAGFTKAQLLFRGYASFDSCLALSEAVVKATFTTGGDH